MVNTSPDPNGQGGNTGPTPGGSPAPPTPAPAPGPAGTAATPPKEAAWLLFFKGLYQDWSEERQLKRELKRARLQQAETVPEAPSEEEVTDTDTDNPQEVMRRERTKRIKMISDFADIKETFDHKLKRYISGAACLVVPWLLVIFMTGDIGEYFAGRSFSFDDWATVGIFGLTALLEIVVAVDTNAWGNTIHDINATEAASDKAQLRQMAWKQGAAWAILSLVSGFALYMFLMQQNADHAAQIGGHLLSGGHADVNYGFTPAHINVILRVIGTLAIDPSCVFAVHQTTKNLDQFLKQQHQVTAAITAVSDVFDEQDEAAARAQMRTRENEQFLKLKSGMDNVNAQMFEKMGEKMLGMSDQMFDQMKLPQGRVVDADDDDERGRNVRRIRG